MTAPRALDSSARLKFSSFLLRVPGLLACCALLLASLPAVPARAQIIDTVAGSISSVEITNPRQIPLVISRAVAVDPTGTYLYIGDDGTRTVRRVDLTNNTSTIVAGGGTAVDDLISLPGRAVSLISPVALAVDGGGNVLIVDDTNNRVRRLSPDGRITTILGNGVYGYSGDGGPALRAQLALPGGIALDRVGNIYIADRYSGAIRKVDRFTNIITTLVGADPDEDSLDSDVVPADKAYLMDPTAVAVDAQGNVLIADTGANVVYRYEAQSRTVRRLAGFYGLKFNFGDGLLATSSALDAPEGVAAAANGDIYIGVVGAVRKISAATGIISTVVGGGVNVLGENRDGRGVALSSGVSQLAITPDGSRMFIATGGDHVVGALNLQTNFFTIVAGSNNSIGDNGPAITAVLGQPDKLALDRAGNLYVADFFHHRIRRISPGATGVGTGIVTTVAGTGARTTLLNNGAALSSAIAFPKGITVMPNGDVVFTDSFRFLRRLDANGNLTTIAGQTTMGFAGDNGPAVNARFNDPHAVISDRLGNLYIADTENHRVRRISTSGIITTIAGTGEAGYSESDGVDAKKTKLNRPIDLMLDEKYGHLYISDAGNKRVVVVFLDDNSFVTAVTLRGEVGGLAMNSAGQVFIGGLNRIYRADFDRLTLDTYAGDGNAGFSGDGGLATLARTSFIAGLLFDADGNLLFTDNVNNRIRRVSNAPVRPVLSVAPGSLTFRASQGGPVPPPQNITIRSSNLVRAGWTASVQMLDGAGWLAVDAATGSTPALLAVSVDASRLTPGTYAGRVVITAPGALNSPASVSVSLVVTPALAPSLDVGPRQLSFRALQGSTDAQSQTVVVNNDGGGSLRFAASARTGSGGAWLQVSPAASTGPALANVAVSAAGLAPGTYRGEVVITNQSANLPSPEAESVFVTLVVDQARPALQVSHTSAVFTASEQSSFVPAQTISVINTGTGAAGWSATVTPLSGGEWLTLSPRSGTARNGVPSRLTLSASPQVAGRPLGAGVYDTLITINAPGAANAPQVILARLRVEGAASLPIPTVQPGGFLVTVEAGDSRVRAGNITLSSSGGTALNYYASGGTDEGGAWLVLDSTAGTILGSADPAQFPIRIAPGGLRVGTYHGHVTFSFSPASPGGNPSATNGAGLSTAEVAITLVIAPGGASSSNALRMEPASSGLNVGLAGTVPIDLKLPPREACNPETLIPQVTSITNNLQLPVGWPAGIRALVVDNCGSVATRASVIATIVPPGAAGVAAADPDYVTLSPLGDGQYSANYNLARPGNYSLFVTAAVPGLRSGRSETVSASSASGGTGGGSLQTPAVSRDGVVSGASFRSFASLAPGQIVSVFGDNLAGTARGALTTPLPTELSGVSIILGGQRMPLYYSGTNQLNAQVPFELPTGSSLPLLVTVGGKASPPEQVSLARSSPGLFTANQTGQGPGVLTNAAGEPLSTANPARRGEVIIAYGTGLGATVPPVPSGTVSPSSPAAQTALPVRAQIGGVNAPVEFAGLTPGYVGLYQVNIRVPADAPVGAAVELTIEQDGATSAPVAVPVQ